MSNPKTPRRTSPSKRFAEIEKISIFGAEARMGPLALQQYAERYFYAAKGLPVSDLKFDPVRLYLVCHSIELALKAYLSLHGALMVELSEGPYGHNLESILGKALERGIDSLVPLRDDHRAEICRANTYYSGKVLEYPAVGEAMRGFRDMPTLDLLIEAAEMLVVSLKEPCLEAD